MPFNLNGDRNLIGRPEFILVQNFLTCIASSFPYCLLKDFANGTRCLSRELPDYDFYDLSRMYDKLVRSFE